MGSINYSQAIRPDTGYIKKIIEASLLGDWAIRIEYECGEFDITDWREWGKTCFAITSAKPVIDALLDCYNKHPNSTIRINAEKFCPQTRLIYTAYNPQYLTTVIEPRTETPARQSPTLTVREQLPLIPN